jgi:hypothetical protein
MRKSMKYGMAALAAAVLLTGAAGCGLLPQPATISIPLLLLTAETEAETEMGMARETAETEIIRPTIRITAKAIIRNKTAQSRLYRFGSIFT